MNLRLSLLRRCDGAQSGDTVADFQLYTIIPACMQQACACKSWYKKRRQKYCFLKSDRPIKKTPRKRI